MEKFDVLSFYGRENEELQKEYERIFCNMTKEEKRLLLIDLCARLPYGVKVQITNDWFYDKIEPYNRRLDCDVIRSIRANKYTVKPYLRPMSSMTDEERKEWYKESHVDYDCEFKPEPTLSLEHCHLSVDWLNKYGFDYRGLIPMGLALEAPKGMYKTEKDEDSAV